MWQRSGVLSAMNVPRLAVLACLRGAAPARRQVVAELVPPGGRWKVTPRWIIDSEKFNEWMNPQDYVTREFEAELEAAGKGGAKQVRPARAPCSMLGCAARGRHHNRHRAALLHVQGGKRGAAGALGAAAKKAKTDGEALAVNASAARTELRCWLCCVPCRPYLLLPDACVLCCCCSLAARGVG